MKYKLQCINDGNPTEAIEMDSIEVIPPWGDLIVTISEHIADYDLERIKIELMRFFGEHRRIGIVRASEMTFTLVPHSGVSAEGAAWAMEGAK